jgi:hypothetical protein
MPPQRRTWNPALTYDGRAFTESVTSGRILLEPNQREAGAAGSRSMLVPAAIRKLTVLPVIELNASESRREPQLAAPQVLGCPILATSLFLSQGWETTTSTSH